MTPLLITIPHSGEQVPGQTPWLKNLPEPVLMSDVDRYVDLLYEPTVKKLGLPLVKTEWHRYAADLNRFPEDVDATSVLGHANKAGSFTRGFHWVKTFEGATLMTEPMPLLAHQELVGLVYDPFHAAVANEVERLRKAGVKRLFHIDAHSMPSKGTSEHRDPGELRADIVVSDVSGKSSMPEFVDLVISSYTRAGFKVAYNWPYLGGRMTERYGKPETEHHTVQVELNRARYMDEASKKLLEKESQQAILKIDKALTRIRDGIAKLL